MAKRPSVRQTIYSILIGAMAYIVLRVIDGLIGNSAFSFATWGWNQLTQSIVKVSWPWIITLIVFLLGLSTSLIFWNQSRIQKQAHTITNNMVELDDSLLRLLASLVSAQDSKNALRKILEELLRNAIQTFPGNVGRGSILLTNSPESNEEYLTIKISYLMPTESINRTKFYIGSDDSKMSERGTVGFAYLNHQLAIGHITGNGECDNKDFINFDRNRLRLPYSSFVNVPIIGPPKGNAITCLGVLCFDSPNSKAFDSLQIQSLLLAFGRRAASTLLIYMQLLQLRN